jgi:hypothetical protein
MRLEHSGQNVAPLHKFIIRLGRYTAFSFILIFVSLLIGTSGYNYFGGLKWLDSFHMACMILTGMGPIAEMTTGEAKLFSSFYALYSGIAFLSVTAIFFAPIFHRLLHIFHVESDNNKSSAPDR